MGNGEEGGGTGGHHLGRWLWVALPLGVTSLCGGTGPCLGVPASAPATGHVPSPAQGLSESAYNQSSPSDGFVRLRGFGNENHDVRSSTCFFSLTVVHRCPRAPCPAAVGPSPPALQMDGSRQRGPLRPPNCCTLVLKHKGSTFGLHNAENFRILKFQSWTQI